MPSHRTFYLVPVTQSTVAAPRSLAPSPCIVPTVSVVTKPANASKRPLSADPIEVLLGEQPQPHQRKRECLDHLTHEQKLNRRKMKNRIAAQTARDRKKYRSQRLEDVIRELLEQNEALKQENDQLRIANQELSEKNKSLVASLYSNEEVTCRVESNKEIICDVYNEMMPDDSETAVESAAFISEPLPRVQVVSLCLLFHLMINIMLAVVFSSRTSSKRYSMSFPTRFTPSFSTLSPVSSNTDVMDDVMLFESQKLLDDPMLSSPSNWLHDVPLALSPFSDSFQREFFQMLE